MTNRCENNDNNCHANIKFTVEFEENCTIPFLDILIKRHNHSFSTSIYRKKTFSGLYTKWDSFTPRKYKVNLIRTLTFRCFRICSSPLLRSCVNELRKLLLQNGYPAGVVNYNINDVLNRQQNRPRHPIITVPKKETILVLPYLGVQSKIVTKQLKTCINKKKTNRKTEHYKGITSTCHASAIADHITATGHNIKWDHFEILAKGRSDTHCKIKETLLIQELKPTLNDNVCSEKLYLY